MAGVAEAMAASSIFIDASSVQKEKFYVSRTCICHSGSSCARMSAAFALAKDPRGDFVVVPSAAIELRTVFYRYLCPKQESDESSDDERGCLPESDGSYSDRSSPSGDGSRASSPDEDRSYSGSETDSCSHSSGVTRSYSDNDDYSIHSDSSGSLSRSYSSRESHSGSDVSCDSLKDSNNRYLQYEPKHESKQNALLEHDFIHGSRVVAGPRLDDEELSLNDMSKTISDDREEYVAAHHFYPNVIESFFDICLERRPEDDLIPLFITTMTESQRRSCGIPIEDDDYDQIEDPHTGERVEDQFWIVPSYSLERVHEDWRYLMRRQLRKQDVNEAAISLLSASEEKDSARLPSSPSKVSMWDIAHALARQMIESRLTAGEEMKGEEVPILNTDSEADTLVLAPHKISTLEELDAARGEIGMLSCLVSSSLTHESISARATNAYAQQAKADIACKVSEVPGVARDSQVESDQSEDEESESHGSSESKSDCTPLLSPPPSPRGTDESGQVKILSGEVTDVPQSSSFGSQTSNSKSKCSMFTVISCCIVVLVMAVATMLRTGCSLAYEEDDLSCSTQRCINCQKLEFALEEAVDFSKKLWCAAAVEIHAMKELTLWIYSPSDYPYSVPIEAHFFRFFLGSLCQSVYEQAFSVTTTTCHHVVSSLVAAYNYLCAVLHFIYTTPPKDQVDAIRAWIGGFFH